MEKEYLSTRKAADMLGVAVSTIQLWTDDGLLSAWTTNGGHRRIALDSIREVLKKRENVFASSKLEKKKLTLVIVEDDSSQLNLYKKQFSARELDVKVVEAKNGYEGLLQIGKHQPSIVITDLMMPDMDGFQMLNTLTNSKELDHCLFIVVSALSKTEVDHLGGLPKGVVFYTKPTPFNELENVILKKMINK
ncbi:MAG: response regulator [Gammaproteobacteria bacterium]|nr:response regulator [Gammaproteobacteria bacterium]